MKRDQPHPGHAPSAAPTGHASATPPIGDASGERVEPDTVAPDEVVPVEEMDLIGGEACLDLVNTGAGRRVGPFREKLRTYGDLVTWAERLDLIDAGRGDVLRGLAKRRPDEAARVLEEARTLREAVYRVFTASTRGESAAPDDLTRIGEAAASAAANRRLVATADGFDYEWLEGDSLERPLWPAATSAAELATMGDLTRVKECASENCNWLFIDESRNRSRRWCDMKDCGNRAKARRFRQRKRSGE